MSKNHDSGLANEPLALRIGVRMAIAVVMIRESFAGIISALIGWWLVLGADPRVGHESRHTVAIVAAAIWMLTVGPVLTLTDRYGSQYGWLWARTAILGATIGLIQLAAEQEDAASRLAIGTVGLAAAIACLLSWVRILIHWRHHGRHAAWLVYGTCSAVLLTAGAYHSTHATLRIEPQPTGNMATYTLAPWFGLGRTEQRQLPHVTKSEYAIGVEYTDGIFLVSSDDALEKMFIPGKLYRGTVAYEALDRVEMVISSDSTWETSETRNWVFIPFLLFATLALWLGVRGDPLARKNTLARDGDFLS